MDPDRIEGRGEQIRGKLRGLWGKITGQPKDRVRGAIERGVGNVQEGYGRLKDEARADAERQREQAPPPGRDDL